jgi:hypothetical protein
MSERVRDGDRYAFAVTVAVAVTHDVGYVAVLVPEHLDVSGPVAEPVAVAITDCERHARQCLAVSERFGNRGGLCGKRSGIVVNVAG